MNTRSTGDTIKMMSGETEFAICYLRRRRWRGSDGDDNGGGMVLDEIRMERKPSWDVIGSPTVESAPSRPSWVSSAVRLSERAPSCEHSNCPVNHPHYYCTIGRASLLKQDTPRWLLDYEIHSYVEWSRSFSHRHW